MDRIGMGLRGLALVVVLAGGGSCSLSSTEYPAASGTGGTLVLVGPGGTRGGVGGAFGEPIDASRCGLPFAVCAVSCGVDALAEASDSGAALTLQVCGPDGLRCPGDLVDINTCPRSSCARHSFWCCDPGNGDVTLAPCQADGSRGCPPETMGFEYLQCVPPALGITSCYSLNGQPCAGDVHACRDGGASCSCQSIESSEMVWVCRPLPLIP